MSTGTCELLKYALDEYLGNLKLNNLWWDDFETLLDLIKNGRKVDAIKHLRTISMLNQIPVMSTEVMNNEFFNFLGSDIRYNVLVKTQRSLGLKQAKDIVDLISSGIHELKP